MDRIMRDKLTDLKVMGDHIRTDHVHTFKHKGFEFGYKVRDLGNGVLLRKVFLKTPDHDLDTVSKNELEPVVNLLFEVFVDMHTPSEPSIDQISFDCLMMSQKVLDVNFVEGQVIH